MNKLRVAGMLQVRLGRDRKMCEGGYYGNGNIAEGWIEV